jgi:hypothetical protein
MVKNLSLKQIAANRRNAQKSTGPKTKEGRAISGKNALKHGILSREVLVRGLNLKESRREFAALQKRLWDHLKPEGPMEEMMVDQILTAQWRLRRALTAESGEIALSVDGGQWKRSRGTHPTLQWMQWGALGDPTCNMRNSAIGNSVLESWLNEVLQSVELEGELTEAAIQKVVHLSGDKPNRLTRELEEFRLKLQQNREGLDAAALREQNKQQALTFLRRRINSIEWETARCEKREANEEEARQAAAVLPSLEVLEKIHRYETKLERQLYRAMAQLERLQRMRQGETIPAPLSLVLSERG